MCGTIGLQLGAGLNTGLGKTDKLKRIGQQQPTSLGLGMGQVDVVWFLLRSLLLSVGIGQSNQPKLGLGECE